MRERITTNPENAKKINAIYKFDLSGDNGGTWTVDLKSDPPAVYAEDRDAECTISMKSDDFINLVNGKLNPQMAFMMGKLKIKGDMSLAMKLQNLLK
ncbi:MAG: sterol-binding protein [Deltaproteobacteria bacterium]|nr:MAG: sterol-binding protein [Deltaproteobacteria bacterium]RME42826.1 MAG: sterol-binding protein [Deltaproteobacteria bacterium]